MVAQPVYGPLSSRRHYGVERTLDMNTVILGVATAAVVLSCGALLDEGNRSGIFSARLSRGSLPESAAGLATGPATG